MGSRLPPLTENSQGGLPSGLAARAGRGGAAIRLRPAEGHRHRADSYWSLGDYDRAVADYGQAVSRLTQDDERAYYDRGYTYRDAGRLDEALADFDMALQLLPTYVEAYRQGRQHLPECGATQRALADLTRAIQLDPRDDANYVSGVIHVAETRVSESPARRSKAIRLRPTRMLLAPCRGLSGNGGALPRPPTTRPSSSTRNTRTPTGCERERTPHSVSMKRPG